MGECRAGAIGAIQLMQSNSSIRNSLCAFAQGLVSLSETDVPSTIDLLDGWKEQRATGSTASLLARLVHALTILTSSQHRGGSFHMLDEGLQGGVCYQWYGASDEAYSGKASDLVPSALIEGAFHIALSSCLESQVRKPSHGP